MYKYQCLSKNYRFNPPEGGATQFCTRECEYCDKDGVSYSESKTEEYICPHTEEVLKVFGKVVFGLIGPKMTKAQIKADRKVRSSQDFAKNVFPTIDNQSKSHHLKKNPSLKKYLS